MRTQLILATAFLAFSAPLCAQAPAPTPEHQRLAVWVGTWTGEWVGKENPMGIPKGVYPFTAVGEWFPGNFHLFQRFQYAATSPTGAYTELAIFGYDPEKKEHLLYDLDSMGTSALFKGTLTGKVWTYTFELSLEGKPAWHRFTITEASPKQATWVNDYSRDGKTWTRFGEGRMAKP